MAFFFSINFPRQQPCWRARESAVQDLKDSLNKKKILREVTLALKTSLRDAVAEFSFLRLRGLRALLKFLRTVSHSDSEIALFCQTQTLPDLQVVPVLFQLSLKGFEQGNVDDLDCIFGVEPIIIASPASDAEVAAALRALEGCCLLHKESSLLAHQHGGVGVLMRILSTRGVLEQGVCLDALIALLVDSSSNQADFEELHGIEEVALLIRDKQVDEKLRLKCGEFLLVLMGHVNGKEKSPMASVHEDVRKLLGEKTASLIWAASQFGSNLDTDQRLAALHIQARRVVESLDLY